MLALPPPPQPSAHGMQPVIQVASQGTHDTNQKWLATSPKEGSFHTRVGLLRHDYGSREGWVMSSGNGWGLLLRTLLGRKIQSSAGIRSSPTGSVGLAGKCGGDSPEALARRSCLHWGDRDGTGMGSKIR